MKMPIPDDWNGQDWYCVQIQWPNSPRWTAILQGFLSLPSFGYFWDERSGTVTLVQGTGFEIHARNLPFTDCDGETIPPTTETETVTETILIFADGDGDDEMGGCYIPRGAARVQNGILQFRDVCGDWYDVATLQDLATTAPDEPLPGTDSSDPETYSLCGKAQGFITAVKAVAFAAWEAAVLDPTQWESTVRSALDWATLGRSSLFLAVSSAQVLRNLASEGTIFDENRWDTMACYAVDGMSDSPIMSEDDRLYALDSIRSVVFGSPLNAAAKESYWNFLKNVSDTIGKGDGRQAGTTGAANLAADCSCIELNYSLVGQVGWQAAPYNAGVEDGITYEVIGRYNENFTLRQQIISNDTGSAFKAWEGGCAYRADIAAGTFIGSLILEYVPITPTDELPHDTTYGTVAEGPVCANLETAYGVTGPSTGRTEENQIVNGKFYKKAVWSGGVSNYFQLSGDARVCPRDDPAKTYLWDINIVAINGQLTGVGVDPGGWTI